MSEDEKKQIIDRRLAIYADIRFDRELEKRLDTLFKSISSTGDTRFLMRRDCYFSYCKERDVWYGSKNTYLYSVNFS